MGLENTDKQLIQFIELFLPKGTLKWFDVARSSSDEDKVYITLVEKDNPPLKDSNQKIIGRKFHDITITDFPIRGKRCLLTFRRRYWKVEGQDSYLKRDIQLAFPGTKLASEFAAFLKADGGQPANFPEYYRYISESSDK